MSRTPLFDAAAARFLAEIDAQCSAGVAGEMRETLDLMRAQLRLGRMTDAQATEGLELAIRLVLGEVPIDVGHETMAGLALTHKGKPTS